jgi:hypothetical protein
MTVELQHDLSRRLLYILHLGFVEARLLALANRSQQVYDLADVMEVLPSLLCQEEQQARDAMRSLLQGYKDKYPDSAFDYCKYLDWHPVPEAY